MLNLFIYFKNLTVFKFMNIFSFFLYAIRWLTALASWVPSFDIITIIITFYLKLLIVKIVENFKCHSSIFLFDSFLAKLKKKATSGCHICKAWRFCKRTFYFDLAQFPGAYKNMAFWLVDKLGLFPLPFERWL